VQTTDPALVEVKEITNPDPPVVLIVA
jgi:hypothetical protein